MLPASPRRRRRLAWGAAATGALAAAAVLAVVIPTRSPPSPAPTTDEGPAQLATRATSHLTRVDRLAIDRTLDRFVPAGMARHDLAAAWALAGPEMKTGSTLATWRAGNTPVPYVVPREHTFHDWETIDVGPRYVIFNLMLHPRDPRVASSFVYSGEVVKAHGRWLVNRLYTIAIMRRPTKTGLHEVGPADFAAPPPGSSREPGKALLGHAGLLPVIGILGLVLLIPIGVGVGALVRARRWRRAVRARDRSALPPLPTGYRADERRREPVGRG
jgi:hypothetical protein